MPEPAAGASNVGEGLNNERANLVLVNPMNPRHIADGHDAFARRYEYDDGTVFAVDFGGASDASVDVVDGTAIVVIETLDGERQEEIDLPAGDARAFMKNGVLTIEVSS